MRTPETPHPNRPPCVTPISRFGRKSCIPAEPVYRGLFDTELEAQRELIKKELSQLFLGTDTPMLELALSQLSPEKLKALSAKAAEGKLAIEFQRIAAMDRAKATVVGIQQHLDAVICALAAAGYPATVQAA